MAKIYLTSEERSTIESVLKHGLERPDEPQWLVARLALARSLQMQGLPGEEFARGHGSRSGGSELHDAQVTGHGSSGHEDFRDAFAALLSVREGKDYITDSKALDDAISRHIRRGIREIGTSWTANSDFFDYLLQETYFDKDAAEEDGDESEGSQVGNRLERVFGQLGIGSQIISREDGPRLTRFVLELDGLDDLDRLRRGLGKMAFALGVGEDSVALALLDEGRQVSLDVPRGASSWKVVTWGHLVGSLSADGAAAMTLPVCVGTDVLGKPVVYDLVNAPHFLIAGTTGSGKSMCIHSILLSLVHGCDLLPRLVLIDPQGFEFATYAGLDCLQTGKPISDFSVAEEQLTALVSEMEQRERRFLQMGASNMREANDRGTPMRRIVVVIDELTELLGRHPDADELLVRLAQAHGVGMHLVLATQHPRANTLSPSLRSNLPTRIAMTVGTSSESRAILGRAGAESLLMRGDMLIKFAGCSIVRGHGCLVHPGDIAKGVRRR